MAPCDPDAIEPDRKICDRIVEDMQIAFAVIAVFWWIAVWGLSDLLVETWDRESKFHLYIATLMVIAVIVWYFPNIVRRF